ncbi:MAG: hypothetical protein IKV74_02905 [Clostridia bacterium]|nr:hypothetical protein [Clostridia bacterium]
MEIQSIEMLDEMEEIITTGRKALLSSRISVDGDELLGLISELRSILPQEIVQANAYYKESQNILKGAHDNAEQIIQKAQDDADVRIARAEKEANSIISDAHEDAELIIKEAENTRQQMIDSHQVTQMATEQARQIVEDANAKAREIRKGTREYMDGKLMELGKFLADTYNEVEANRKAL